MSDAPLPPATPAPDTTAGPPPPTPVALGLSGALTRAFISSPLTPLLLLASLVMGIIALMALPREEEPQISVPMVDVHVRADGLRADDAVELVTKPLEEILKGIDGVEHVYTQTQDDGLVATARFLVGTDADDAILRVHEKVRANYDRMPMGIPEPLIVGRGINDVAIVVLTLSAKPEAAGRWDDTALLSIAEEMQADIARIADVGYTYIVGGRPAQIRVEPDPERLARYGITLNQLVDKVRGANRSFALGSVRDGLGARPVVAGQTLVGGPDIGQLLLTSLDGRPVYVKDVATIVSDAQPLDRRAWHLLPGGRDGALTAAPAVSLAIAKRAGANAVVIADAVMDRVAALRETSIPADLDVTVTRNYGETASDKANELLFHLGLATVSIVLLIALTIGWREGIVTLVVVPITILLTLFASWLMGYTLNRVSLFALIFAIGILVDDAIVVVENIDRHWSMKDGRSKVQAAIEAVAEVGNPTIVATLTVIAALLPMMFVSGLMGPYMSPIPANASAAMLFSFFVAMVLTPWLMVKLRPGASVPAGHGGGGGGHEEGALGRLYRRVAEPVIRTRRRAGLFLAAVAVATLASFGLFASKDVTVKLLPFDNKSELQVVVDLPAGSSVEETERLLFAMADRVAGLAELTSIQAYAGTAAPFNFNGLVRHSYLRRNPEMGELVINLTDRHDRERESHDIALDVRARLMDLPKPDGTIWKVVEVPPGPPVLSTLLAEVYGPDAETRRAAAEKVADAYRAVPFIVDVDSTVRTPVERLRFALLPDRLEFHGVEEQAVYDTLGALIGGVPVGYSHQGAGKQPIQIAVHLPKADLSVTERLLSTPVPGRQGLVELGDLVRVEREPASHAIFRRNGYPAEMVMAELAGDYGAPIYGMLAVAERIEAMDWGPGGPPQIRLAGQPEALTGPALLWDGEWEITRVTFRDMGLAFAVAILAIYLLVVAQFGSFKVPLVILLPVPLTLLGIILGHWLFNAPFGAPSMIGFIALAGIIVRNSILLVDFIRHSSKPGAPLKEVLLEAGAVRFKPILLTAVAAMIGAAFILPDPIFQGLAISLLFGLLSSTLLTVLAIPAVYVLLRTPKGEC